jgi:hypothetical protein
MDPYYAILLRVEAGRFFQCFYRYGIFFQMDGITAERLMNHECQESSQDLGIAEIRVKEDPAQLLLDRVFTKTGRGCVRNRAAHSLVSLMIAMLFKTPRSRGFRQTEEKEKTIVYNYLVSSS